MKLLSKLTLKSLKLNKKRTIVTIIGIILSVALLTALSTMYTSTIESLITYAINEKGDYHVGYYNVPVNELETFYNNRSIEEVSITKKVGYALLNDSKNKYKPYAYIEIFDKNALNNLKVELEEGRLPENENEILIPTHLKTNGRIDLKVGDYITLDVGTRTSDNIELTQDNPFDIDTPEEIINTESKTYKIVGIIKRPASSIEPYTAPGYTFITYSNKPFTGNIDIYAKYTKEGIKNYLKVTAGILEIDENIYEKGYFGNYDEFSFERYIEEISKSKYEVSINNYLISLQSNILKDGTVVGLGIVVTIVCIIIIFTSVFCIKNSFDISITEKNKQYGMLRSLGATKKQIKKNVLYEGTVLGLIAIPIGLICGLLASYILIVISNYFIEGLLTDGLLLVFKVSYISIILSILLSIITIYLSAIKSAKKASNISPIDSIRNSGEIKIKSKNLNTPKIIKKLFGIGGEISYKNLKRNKRKYRTTVISIIVSVAVFIALSTFMKLAFMTIDVELSFKDYNVSLSSSIENDIERYNNIISTINLENIKDYTIYRHLVFTIDDPSFSKEYIDLTKANKNEIQGSYLITALGEHQYKKYIKSLGLNYEKMKDKAIVSDNTTLSESKDGKIIKHNVRVYDYKKGDTLTGKLNDKNNTELSINIGYVADKKPMGLKEYDNEMLIVSEEYFNKLNDINRYIKIFYDSNNPNKLQDDIEELLKTENYNLENIAENVKSMQNLYTLLGIFLYGFIIVISLIGITNIFNTITTNMELRKREFATLKSIGMTKKEFNKMIRLESIFMGTKSLIYGITIGLILSYIIYKSLSSEGFSYPLPIIPIIIVIIAVFLLITLIMKYSMNKINKQNTIETIRNENI